MEADMAGNNNAYDEIKSRIRKIKANKITAAVLSVVFGVILMIWSGAAITVAFKIFGAVLAVGGIVAVISFLVSHDNSSLGLTSLIGGVVIIVLGAWIFMKPEGLASLFPIIIGIIVIVSGISDIGEAIRMNKTSYSRWYGSLIIGIVMIALGLVLILKPLGVANVIVKMIGIVLILNGVSDLYVIFGISSAAKEAKRAFNTVDAEATVVNDSSDRKDKSTGSSTK